MFKKGGLFDKLGKKIDKNFSKAIGMEDGVKISGLKSINEEKRKQSENQLKEIFNKKDNTEENVETTPFNVPQPMQEELNNQSPLEQNEQIQETNETISFEDNSTNEIPTVEVTPNTTKKISMKEQVLLCKSYAKENLDLKNNPNWAEFIDNFKATDREKLIKVLERKCKVDDIGLEMIKTSTTDNPFFFPPNEEIDMGVSGEVLEN